MQIKLKKLSTEAVVPTQNKKFDAGYDLYSTSFDSIKSGERKLFKTDISMSIPQGYYGRIADRSGNAYNKGTHVLAGVIDSSYVGNIGVVLFNTSKSDVLINKGDKIAQIIIEKCHDVEFVEVSELNPTDRGDKGFGSSGN